MHSRGSSPPKPSCATIRTSHLCRPVPKRRSPSKFLQRWRFWLPSSRLLEQISTTSGDLQSSSGRGCSTTGSTRISASMEKGTTYLTNGGNVSAVGNPTSLGLRQLSAAALYEQPLAPGTPVTSSSSDHLEPANSFPSLTGRYVLHRSRVADVSGRSASHLPSRRPCSDTLLDDLHDSVDSD